MSVQPRLNVTQSCAWHFLCFWTPPPWGCPQLDFRKETSCFGLESLSQQIDPLVLGPHVLHPSVDTSGTLRVITCAHRCLHTELLSTRTQVLFTAISQSTTQTQKFNSRKRRWQNERHTLLNMIMLLLLLLLSRFSRVQLCATPETTAHQAPPSLGFSRQEHWSGLPFPSP